MKIMKFGLPICKQCTTLTEQMKMLDLSTFEVEDINLLEYETSKELVDKYNIKSVPTLVILNDAGDEIERVISFTQLELFLRTNYLYKPKYVAGFDDYSGEEQEDKSYFIPKPKEKVLKLLYSFSSKIN